MRGYVVNRNIIQFPLRILSTTCNNSLVTNHDLHTKYTKVIIILKSIP